MPDWSRLRGQVPLVLKPSRDYLFQQGKRRLAHKIVGLGLELLPAAQNSACMVNI